MSGEASESGPQVPPATAEWLPLAVSYVEYPGGDYVGKALAFASLLPLAIITGFITLILFRRDLHTISFFIGTLSNELVNLVLKNVICEARPLLRKNGLYTEYGMPSSHSQFMWFFTTYVACFVCVRLHHMNNNSLPQNLWKAAIISTCLGAAGVVTISRVYLLYHTWGQVLCGCILGIIYGLFWFAVTQFILTPLFPHIVSWPICEFLMIRDTTLIPNVLWFEYTNSRQEARARGRKLVSMKSQ